MDPQETGDSVDQWLQAKYDACTYEFERSRRNTIGDLLADYRQHADTGTPLNSEEEDKLSPVSPRHAAAVKLTTSIEARRAQIERFRRQTSHDYTQGYLDALDDVAIDMGLIPPSAGRPDRT